jgi:hypothetical protein
LLIVEANSAAEFSLAFSRLEGRGSAWQHHSTFPVRPRRRGDRISWPTSDYDPPRSAREAAAISAMLPEAAMTGREGQLALRKAALNELVSLKPTVKPMSVTEGAGSRHSPQYVVAANEMMPERRCCVEAGEDKIGSKVVQFLDGAGCRPVRREGRRDREEAKKLSASPRSQVSTTPRLGTVIKTT